MKCRLEQRSYCECRNNADDKTRQYEELSREAHEERRFPRRARQLFRREAEENLSDEPQRIGDGEHAGSRYDVRQRLIHERVVMNFDGFGEEHLLGQKAIK